MNKNPNTEAIHITESPAFQESEGTKQMTKPASLASIGGIIAAFLASLCCIGPVLFAALGVGAGATGMLASTAGFLKAFVPYRSLLSLWWRLEPDFTWCIASLNPPVPQTPIVRIHGQARNQ